MAKKVTGRTDQGSKEYPGDEAYKKLFAKMLEEDKKKEKKKSEKKISAKESKGLLKVDDSSIKKIHGTISKLTGHVRKAVIRIGSLEKRSDKIEGRADKIEEKTSKIVNILKGQKSKIGEKIPGSSRDSLNKTLIETNKILVDIQKQLTLQSKNEEKQQKEKSRKDSASESRKRLKAEESLLEKTSKGIGKVIGKVASKSLEPISNIFDKIMSFIALIGAGIATNAVLEWLKDDKNREKINEWFGWIKDHWKWVLAGLGAIALIPVITTIAGLIGPIGTIVGLLLKGIPVLIGILTNPIFLGFAAAAGLIFAGKATLDFFKRMGAGGEAHLNAFEALKAELAEAGIDVIGGKAESEKFYISGSGKGRGGTSGRKTVEEAGSEEQKKLLASYIKRRDALIANKNAMGAEINKQRDAVIPIMKTVRTRGVRTKEVEDRKATNKLRNEAESKVRKEYEANIQGILEARKIGGPVMAGKPYIVGEGGPELFSPNINGSILSNYRTEKIYQMLSSDMNQGGGINMIELPPITNQMPPPEIPVPTQQATDVPEISSTNMADPYRQLSPLLYGITV